MAEKASLAVRIEEGAARLREVEAAVGKVVVGQSSTVGHLLDAVLAGGQCCTGAGVTTKRRPTMKKMRLWQVLGGACGGGVLLQANGGCDTATLTNDLVAGAVPLVVNFLINAVLGGAV